MTHSTDQFTRQHEIQLDMTIVSSERVVSVDGTAKLKQMWYYSKYAAVLDSNASLTFLSI